MKVCLAIHHRRTIFYLGISSGPPDQIQKPEEAITFHSVVILPGVSITNKSKRDIEEERGGSLPRYRGDSRERSNEQTKTRKPQEIAFGRALKASRECRWKSGRVHTVHVQTEPGKFSRATPRNYSLPCANFRLRPTAFELLLVLGAWYSQNFHPISPDVDHTLFALEQSCDRFNIFSRRILMKKNDICRERFMLRLFDV